MAKSEFQAMAKAFELVTNDIDQAGGKTEFIDDSWWCDLWHGCCTELEITLRAKLRAAGYNVPLNDWEV